MYCDYHAVLLDIELLDLKAQFQPHVQALSQFQQDCLLAAELGDFNVTFCDQITSFQIDGEHIKIAVSGLTTSEKANLWQALFQTKSLHN